MTVFYRITLPDVLNALQDSNIWLYCSFVYDGFNCLDIDHLYGSKIIDSTLYLCITDREDISVKGASTDPEDALDKYSIDDLASYIENGTSEIIQNYIDEYAINTPLYDKWAPMILSNGYKFTDIVDDYIKFEDWR